MIWHLIVAMAVVPLALGAADEAESDAGKIEGRWMVVSFTRAGRASDKLVGDMVVFADGRSVYHGKMGVEQSKYWIDSTKTPKHFDLELVDREGNRRRSAGIYKFEGDALIICHGAPGDPRPDRFESDESNGWIVVVLEQLAEDVDP